jgi:rod shape-determining protein MreC
MRVRKRHAWSVVLVVLFALPVLQPRGFPGLEGFLDATLAWPARNGVLAAPSPGDAPSGPPTARERDLEVENAQVREALFQSLDESRQRSALEPTHAGLASLWRSIPARVVRAKDASSLRRSVRIDKGTEDGVAVGHAVTQGAVYLGRVEQVESRAARVQLVSDRRARLELAVRTADGQRAVGYLAGGGDDVLRLRGVRAVEGVVVRVGDPVLTSNGDERIQPGLVVGRVERVGGVGTDAFLDVEVRPLFDLSRTTSVLVVRPSE